MTTARDPDERLVGPGTAGKREEAFDRVEPGCGGRCEVDVKARVPSEPGLDRRRLVRSVVVHDQVDVQHRRHVGLDGAKELQEFAAAVPAMRLTDDLAGCDVQRREQCRRPVALVVVRAPGRDAGRQRQLRLRAVQENDTAGTRGDTHFGRALHGKSPF